MLVSSNFLIFQQSFLPCWRILRRIKDCLLQSLSLEESKICPFGKFLLLDCRVLTTLIKKAFENIVGEGEKVGKQHLLLFPLCFLLPPTTNSRISAACKLSSANVLKLAKSKLLTTGRG